MAYVKLMYRCCKTSKTTPSTPIVKGGKKGFRSLIDHLAMQSSPTATSLFIPKRNEPEDVCASPEFTEDLFPYILACLYLLLGIFYITCGYRYFKASMFSTGFTFVGAVVYLLCIQEKLLPPYGNYIVSVCAGILFGLITMYIQYVGIFVSGFQNGVFLGISGITIYDHVAARDAPTTYWQTVLILMMSGILGACLNMYFKKGLTIVSTSVYGGAYIVMSLDYLIHRGATIMWVFHRVKLDPAVTPPCSLSWLLLALWPICAILGIIIQWTLIGNGIRHEESLAAQKRRLKASQPHLSREQRAEMRQRKYRYLYQVRTAHGDVISQSYVQALQQKTSNSDPWQTGGECSTLQSDSTHLTVLASDPTHPDSEEEVNQRACR